MIFVPLEQNCQASYYLYLKRSTNWQREDDSKRGDILFLLNIEDPWHIQSEFVQAINLYLSIIFPFG